MVRDHLTAATDYFRDFTHFDAEVVEVVNPFSGVGAPCVGIVGQPSEPASTQSDRDCPNCRGTVHACAGSKIPDRRLGP